MASSNFLKRLRTVGQKYCLGQTYIDKGGIRQEADQFLRWLNIPGSGMPNSPGIRPLRFTTNLADHGLPSYLVLVTHEATGGQLNPWDDIVDLSNAEILYWGDAKVDTEKEIDDFRGNRVLRKIYDYTLTGQRELAPPILHFSKPKKGIVKFNGLCVLDSLDISWFDDHGKAVQNYHVKLTVLDCAEVSVGWLHHRVTCDSIAQLDKHNNCPHSWSDYKKGNKKPIDIFIKQVRTEDQQLPTAGSEDDRILQQLVNLDPFVFEGVIVALFKEMKEITHKITGTRATSDGGFDFFGTFKLPRPLSYEIHFRGEVKRYSRTTVVDPKSVSRLVARLKRQEYGIFVTTSYFTKQAQKEVLSDGYPVHLISGADLLLMLKHLRKIKDGTICDALLEEGAGHAAD